MFFQKPRADARANGRAESGGLLDDGDMHRDRRGCWRLSVAIAGPLAAPPVRTAFVDGVPGQLLDYPHVRQGDIGGTLLDGAEALDASGPAGLATSNPRKPGRGVHPAIGLHHVGEQPDHAVGRRGVPPHALRSMTV